MPAWNPQANDIFLDALEIAAPADRRTFIERACAGDTELQGQVVSLLEASQKAGSFLEIPPSAVAVQADATINQPITEGPSTVIGPYQLLQQIGEGGFGVVFMADQTKPVKRRVALKIIKPGMDTRQVTARFEAERQALAMMDHPNIAKVLDAGTTESGRPYFVMELVKGVPMTQYCDEKQLTPRERLELFVPVCQALQHAHQKGIIHRDIKPSNVLVGEYDDRPVPRIIDFGVAKATSQKMTEKTMFTQFGQILGTIDYMSPEQAKLNELDIDTRSDIYSLGVLLYELLTGETPFDRQRLRSAAFDELLQIIREEEPPKPSLRLSTSESLPSIATNRHTEPKKLGTLVHGELDWIVMKALEKDRTRRYETATGFANDVRRYLNVEAVLARPPSAAYRLKKFARRNKAVIGTASVVAAALILGIVATGWQAIRATRQQNRAIAAEGRAQQNAEKAGQNARKSAENAALACQQRDLSLQRLYVADMRLAHEDWNSGNLSRMIATLNAHRPVSDLSDLRGWEWYYLATLLQEHEGLYDPQIGSIHRVEWDPDGRLVAIAGDNGAQVYEPISHHVVHSWTSYSDLTWSPDGSRLAAVSHGQDDRVIRIVSTQDWKELHTHKSKGLVRFLAWSHDGNALAWGASRQKYCIWEVGEKGAESYRYPTPKPFAAPYMESFSMTSLAWEPAGRSLVFAGSFPSYLVFWDSVEKKPSKVLDVDTHRGFTQVTSSPEGKRLATPSIDGDICIWNVASGQLILKFRAHNGQISACSWSPDGQQLISGGEDHLVRLWNAETGMQLNVLSGHRTVVRAVDWSSRGDWIVSADNAGHVRFWQPSESSDAQLIPGLEAVAWSPNGKWVVSNDPTNERKITYSIRDSRTGQIFQPLESKPDDANADWHKMVHVFSWSPNGKLIAGACFDDTVYVWDTATGRATLTLDKHHAQVRCVAWSPDNRQFATCGMDRQVKIWETATGKLLRAFSAHHSPLGSVCWSPDGRWFASADWGRDVNIRATDTWQIEWEIDQKYGGPEGNYAVAWKPDSRELATINATGQIVVWKLLENNQIERVWSVDAHTSNVRSLAWSPDGRRIASASEDLSVKIWDAETGRDLLTFKGFERMVVAVVWSPDGSRLAAADEGSLRIWEAGQTCEQLGPTRIKVGNH